VTEAVGACAGVDEDVEEEAVEAREDCERQHLRREPSSTGHGRFKHF
jgi:hypothetical protein